MVLTYNTCNVLNIRVFTFYQVGPKHFSCCVKNVRMKFYRTFNCIYCRSKGANSELVSLQLFKSYCLPFMLYATEVVPLTKSSVKVSDDCVQIFKVNDRDNIAVIRRNCNLPYIGTVIEQRRLNFVNKILDSSYLACLFVLWFYFSCVVPSVVLHLSSKCYFIFTVLLLCTAFMRIKIYI